jgi:hypothetical protein
MSCRPGLRLLFYIRSCGETLHVPREDARSVSAYWIGLAQRVWRDVGLVSTVLGAMGLVSIFVGLALITFGP